MVRDAWFRLENADRLVRLYRDDLLPQAARAMESTGTLFKQGQGSFSDYVETQSAWYNFQLALARAKADYGKYLARLEKYAGRSLTRREAQPASDGAREGSK
jgi:outer membrane protein TolC